MLNAEVNVINKRRNTNSARAINSLETALPFLLSDINFFTYSLLFTGIYFLLRDWDQGGPREEERDQDS